MGFYQVVDQVNHANYGQRTDQCKVRIINAAGYIAMGVYNLNRVVLVNFWTILCNMFTSSLILKMVYEHLSRSLYFITWFCKLMGKPRRFIAEYRLIQQKLMQSKLCPSNPDRFNPGHGPDKR